MEQKVKLGDLRSIVKYSSCEEWLSIIEEYLIRYKHCTDNFKINIKEEHINLLQEKGTFSQKEGCKKIGIILKEDYLEKHCKCNLKVGDRVKIIRTAVSYENGWKGDWVSSMNNHVGKIFQITEDDKKNGFELENHYNYPYFVLEKVVEEYIPFTFEDDLLGMKIISKDRTTKEMIIYQNQNYIITGSHTRITYEELLNSNFRFLDGNRCGKLKIPL